MAQVIPDLFCALEILQGRAFALLTISTHCDIALASAIFLPAGQYGALLLAIQTFAPRALAQTCATAHAGARKPIRPPALALQCFSFQKSEPNRLRRIQKLPPTQEDRFGKTALS